MGAFAVGQCWATSQEAADAFLLTFNVSAPVQIFPECAYATPADALINGGLLGWAVVGVWVAAWAIHVLRRGL